MAFLNPVRLSFAGQFQADVSTVNNDVRHYDDAAFVPSFQDLQTKANMNGWWNPTGSGAFRFIDCRITGVHYADGTSTDDPAVDPVVGMTIAGAAERTSGKLVDIDPQWQLASAPWGLQVRLLDGDRECFGGDYQTNAFRDLWFSRLANSGGDGAASSTFQSIVKGVRQEPTLVAASRGLTELFERTSGDQLSIRMATFGYDGSASSPTFTLGTMIGSIGPSLAGEPESFVLGRRFAPAAGFSSWAGITYFSGLLDHDSRSLLLDLSNALSINDITGTSTDFGALSVGVLRDDSVVENTPVTTSNFEWLADIDYLSPGWLQRTGGVVAVPLTAEQLELAQVHPLALVAKTAFNPGQTGMDDGLGVVAIRETTGGLFSGAEPAVHRVDAGESTELTCYAARYGQRLPSQQIALRQLGAVPQQGGGGTNPDVNHIPIPDMGVPEAALSVPSSVTTADTGSVGVSFGTGNPDNPRGYLDGQVYLVDYRLPGQSNGSKQPFEFIVLHVRDAYQVPDTPTWERDVKPIFTQFGNLYPIMSKSLIKLSDPASVLANRQLLELAFSRPIDDPNYMPVTRDLSRPKQEMILRWLRGLGAAEDPSLTGDIAASRPVAASRSQARMASLVGAAATQATADGVAEGPADDSAAAAGSDAVDSKTRFADQFLRAGRAPK